MRKTFSVKNFKKFQHYKDRNPPWIKLHRTIFTDYEFSCLHDASKLHLMLIWLLASQLENKLPYDSDWIKNQIGVKQKVDLKALEDWGFIVVDSGQLAGCKQSADGETEAEAYKQETETTLNEKETFALSWENNFEDIWTDYPEKKGKAKAKRHFHAQVTTPKDWSNIWDALINYEADMENIRANGHSDRAWMHGATWFNENWRDFINYKPPPKPETADEKRDREIKEMSKEIKSRRKPNVDD